MRSLRWRSFFHVASLCAGAQLTMRKGACAMGDAVAVIYGIFLFVLLILYVKGCEKV
jgi:hypothetical protein